MDQRPANPENLRAAHNLARKFFLTETDPESIRKAVRRWLVAIPWVVVLIPAIFWLRFGAVTPLGWGLTIFFVVYCLLSAIGLHFLIRPEYHTPVVYKNDWIDRIGAFWLVACALGPLFGWMLTTGFWITANSWQWFYGGRVLLAIVLPVITSFALLRYVRGHGAPLMLALLVGVTALPVWSGWATLIDLKNGPVVENDGSKLPRTDRMLK
ncbi:MAG TPA: hypothetical protein VI306_24045 [Pyrinomonadaceae bacterium]